MKDTKDTKINPSAFFWKSGSATLGQVLYQQRYGELTEGVMQAMRDITEEFAKWDDQQRVHVMTRPPRNYAEVAWYREETRKKVVGPDLSMLSEGERRVYEEGVFHRMVYEEAELVKSRVEEALAEEDRADVHRQGTNLVTQCSTRMEIAEQEVRRCVTELQRRGHDNLTHHSAIEKAKHHIA